MEKIILSPKGLSFKKKSMNEENVKAGIEVMYENAIYTTGNRRHTQVELYRGDKFVLTVAMKNIQLIKRK